MLTFNLRESYSEIDVGSQIVEATAVVAEDACGTVGFLHEGMAHDDIRSAPVQ